jgi:hypothetical protein
VHTQSFRHHLSMWVGSFQSHGDQAPVIPVRMAFPLPVAFLKLYLCLPSAYLSSLDFNNDSWWLPFAQFCIGKKCGILNFQNVFFWVFLHCSVVESSQFNLDTYFHYYPYIERNFLRTFFFQLICISSLKTKLFCVPYFGTLNSTGHIFFLFLSLWLVNSEKEVQFECSDDGEDLCLPDFSSYKNLHLGIRQLYLPTWALSWKSTEWLQLCINQLSKHATHFHIILFFLWNWIFLICKKSNPYPYALSELDLL